MRILTCFLFFLTLCFSAIAQSEWTAIMTQGTQGQVYDSFWDFNDVEDFIREKAKKGQVISELEYGNGEWYAVATQRTGLITISWKKDKSWPDDYIREQWDKDKYITRITWGKGEWVVIMTDKTPFVKQKWITRKSWDDMTTAIKAEWKKEPNYNITDLSYGDGLWAVVLSSTGKYEAQSYKVSKEFPQSWIQDKYNEKYNITSVEHDGTEWYVVMTKKPSQLSETILNPQSDFPRSKIKEQWDKNRRITGFVYTGKRNTNDDFDDALAGMLDYNSINDDWDRLSKHKTSGAAYLDDKNYLKAIEEFKEAVKIDKNDHQLWNSLAWSRYLAGYCYSAFDDVNKSIELESNSYNNHTKAAILKCQGKCQEALTYYNEAIRLRRAEFGKVDEILYYVDRAEAKKCLKNYSGALDDIELALTIEPDNSTLKSKKTELNRLISR